MINLLVDGLIALVKIIDAGMSAVEKNVHGRPVTPPMVDRDAPSAGAGSPQPQPAPADTLKFNNVDIVKDWYTFDEELTAEFTRTDPVDPTELLLLQAAVYLMEFQKVSTEAQAKRIYYRVPGLPPVDEVIAGLRDLQAQFAADADPA